MQQQSLLNFFKVNQTGKRANTDSSATSTEGGNSTQPTLKRLKTPDPSPDERDQPDEAPSVKKTTSKVQSIQSLQKASLDRSPSTTSAKKKSPAKRSRKRSRIIDDDEESDDDWMPQEKEPSEDSDSDLDNSMFQEDLADLMDTKMEEDDENQEESPVKCRTKKTPKTPQNSPSKSSRLAGSSFSPISSPLSKNLFGKRAENAKVSAEESKFTWMNDVRDAQRRPPSDPDYDCTSLYIPESGWGKLTPFEQQYWRVKEKYFETVVFFKKGKFYELYDMDADIGQRDFGLKMTDRVSMRMVGVPDHTRDHWMAQFLAKGYKVTQVDQVETTAKMHERVKDKAGTRAKKAPTVIMREVTKVFTPGTLTDGSLMTDHRPCVLLVLHQLEDGSVAAAATDSCMASMWTFFFDQDNHQTKLDLLLVRFQPKELILDNSLKRSKGESTLLDLIQERLGDGVVLNFVDLKGRAASLEEFSLPSEIEPENTLACLSTAAREEILRVAGAGFAYLVRMKVDAEVLPHLSWVHEQGVPSLRNLQLDAQTLYNLDIILPRGLSSPYNLLERLEKECATSWGKRLLYRWLCTPLAVSSAVMERVEAVEALRSEQSDSVSMQEEHIHKSLKSLPDLERLYSKLRSSSQPNVKELIELVKGLDVLHELVQYISSRTKEKSVLLRQITSGDSSAALSSKLRYPVTLESTLSFLSSSFDMKAAAKSGVFEPLSGADPVYEEAAELLQKAEQRLEDHRAEVERDLGKASVKITYLLGVPVLEIPATVTPPNYLTLRKQTGKVKRYESSETKKCIEVIRDAQVHVDLARDQSLCRVLSRVFEGSTHGADISALLEIGAYLDCLCALGSLPGCKPTVLDATPTQHHVLEVKRLKPLVPNPVPYEALEFPPSVWLLTGSNMSGKSTLLRTVGLVVFLAQLGCCVPADECTLTMRDRIFTRIGAHDEIFAGKSTFLVEMQETSDILNEATSDSLVIIDELGRGTSTFDGHAIAHATLSHLSEKIGATVLFSTHYHLLCKEFAYYTNVALKVMVSIVDEESLELVPLYRLEDGFATKSSGMNVAALAGIPMEIVKRASYLSAVFEAHHREVTKERQMEVLIDLLQKRDQPYPTIANSYREIRHLQDVLGAGL